MGVFPSRETRLWETKIKIVSGDGVGGGEGDWVADKKGRWDRKDKQKYWQTVINIQTDCQLHRHTLPVNIDTPRPSPLLSSRLFSTLFYSILFHSILFLSYSIILFSSVLFCSLALSFLVLSCLLFSCLVSPSSILFSVFFIVFSSLLFFSHLHQ